MVLFTSRAATRPEMGQRPGAFASVLAVFTRIWRFFEPRKMVLSRTLRLSADTCSGIGRARAGWRQDRLRRPADLRALGQIEPVSRGVEKCASFGRRKVHHG